MIVLPAIDLFGGKVVRLTKGDFSRKTDYEADPCQLAHSFREQGCSCLHIVDLEGAKLGRPKHLNELCRLARLGFSIEYGGGLRDSDAIESALDAGASWAMVGSVLFADEETPRRLFSRFGKRLMPCIDVKNGKVAHSGWQKESDVVAPEFLANLSSLGYDTFLVTGIERDGTLSGPDLGLYRSLPLHTGRIIAAGGVSSIGDIQALKKIGVSGAVVGKAIYEKNFDLKEALAVASGRPQR